MPEFCSAAVPFVRVDNRVALTDEQLVSSPWLAEFVERFRHCFERDDVLQCYFYLPTLPEDHP